MPDASNFAEAISCFIDSKYRLSGKPHNFQTVTFLTDQYNEDFMVYLESLAFPHLYPTIKGTKNDYFELFIDNIPTMYEVTVNESGYTADSLAELLTYEIQQRTTGLTEKASVSYDITSKSLNVNIPAGRTLRFVLPAVDSGNYRRQFRFLQMIGMLPFVNRTLSSSFQTEYIDLSGTKYVDLVVNVPLPVVSNSTPGLVSGVLSRIHFREEFGGYIFHEDPSPSKSGYRINASHLNRLTIQLRDEWGEEFELPSAADVSIQLKLVPIRQ